MANKLSDLMTNYFASVPVFTDVNLDHARKRVAVCRTTVLVADGAGVIHRLKRFKASDCILSIKILNDGAATVVNDLNIGIRTPAATGGAADDPGTLSKDDALVNGYDASTAAVVPTEILGTGNTTNAARIGKQLWDYCALTRPATGTEYELILTVVGDPLTADEVMTFVIEYVAGD